MQKDKIEAKRSYQMEKNPKDTQTQIIREVEAQNIDIGDMQALNIRETQEPNMDIRETQDVQAQNTSHKQYRLQNHVYTHFVIPEVKI